MLPLWYLSLKKINEEREKRFIEVDSLVEVIIEFY
jgi:hypothetical protein